LHVAAPHRGFLWKVSGLHTRRGTAAVRGSDGPAQESCVSYGSPPIGGTVPVQMPFTTKAAPV